MGLAYDRPAYLMRNYLEVLNARWRGPGQVDVENELFRVHSPINVADPTPMPIVHRRTGARHAAHRR